MFCGCVGVNGGGLAHYVGQEKLAPGEPWSADRVRAGLVPGRRGCRTRRAGTTCTPTSGATRRTFTDYHTVPARQRRDTLGARPHDGHAGPRRPQRLAAVLPAVQPQPARGRARGARRPGRRPTRRSSRTSSTQLKSGELQVRRRGPGRAGELAARLVHLARQRADGEREGPRVLPQALPRHPHNAIAEELAEGLGARRSSGTTGAAGKMDLVVDLNFRMDTSALYSDIVLPAATWYEKADLNSTDMHSFIHPLSAAVPPCWESKSDWQIFRALAQKFSELAAQALPRAGDGPGGVAARARHGGRDRAADDAATGAKGEVRGDPGQDDAGPAGGRRATTRTSTTSSARSGPLARDRRPRRARHALRDRGRVRRGARRRCRRVDVGRQHVPLARGRRAGLRRDPARSPPSPTASWPTARTRTWRRRSALPLAHLAEKNRGVRINYKDLQARPHALRQQPDVVGPDRRTAAPTRRSPTTSSAWCRGARSPAGSTSTSTTRCTSQFGEHLPTYKPKPLPAQYARPARSASEVGPTQDAQLPHAARQVAHPLDLRRQPADDDAVARHRAVLDERPGRRGASASTTTTGSRSTTTTASWSPGRRSARASRAGICIQYHSPERTLLGAASRRCAGNRRAGGHNSLTRTRLKPNLMVGGYGQFTFHFNYWGPVGCNRDTHVLVRKLPEAAASVHAPGRSACAWTSARRSRWCSTSTSASGATPAASPARTSGPTARAPSTCGGTTSRPSRAPAIPTQWEDQDEYQRRLGDRGRQARSSSRRARRGSSPTSSTTRTMPTHRRLLRAVDLQLPGPVQRAGGRRPAHRAARSR